MNLSTYLGMHSFIGLVDVINSEPASYQDYDYEGDCYDDYYNDDYLESSRWTAESPLARDRAVARSTLSDRACSGLGRRCSRRSAGPSAPGGLAAQRMGHCMLPLRARGIAGCDGAGCHWCWRERWRNETRFSSRGGRRPGLCASSPHDERPGVHGRMGCTHVNALGWGLGYAAEANYQNRNRLVAPMGLAGLVGGTILGTDYELTANDRSLIGVGTGLGSWNAIMFSAWANEVGLGGPDWDGVSLLGFGLSGLASATASKGEVDEYPAFVGTSAAWERSTR